MTIFNNISADFVLMSADYIIENGHSFEWNEDPVTVFLKWMDFRHVLVSSAMIKFSLVAMFFS